jgi:ribosome-associated protein
MDIRKLQRVIVDGLEDVKAQNIVVFNTEHLSPLFERVIVASGTSNRQTRSLAASVRDAVKSAGEPAPRTEGEDNGEWIIVDCGAAVVHVMQPAIREYYHLEELWGDKPVRMKIGAAPPPRLVKAEGPPAQERRASPRRADGASAAKAPRRGGAPVPSRASRRRRATSFAQWGSSRRRRMRPPRCGRRRRAGRRPRSRAPSAERRRASVASSERASRAHAVKLVLVAVGTRVPAWADEVFADYAKRMPPELRLELKTVKAEARTGKTPAQHMSAEALRIEAALPRGARRIALDEHGARVTSVELAARLLAWRGEGRDAALVAGGPDGLDPIFKASCDETLRLSDLTLPHAFVRALVAEAIYRAWSINANHPYHRE